MFEMGLFSRYSTTLDVGDYEWNDTEQDTQKTDHTHTLAGGTELGKKLSKINISHFSLKHYSQTDFTLNIETEKDPKHGNQLTIYNLESNTGA